MHRPIEDNLEVFLSGAGPENLTEFHSHLSECAECREEVGRLEEHSTILRSLRVEDDIEPAPGFYARVMERVAAQRNAGVWSAFLDPVFSRRLAYAMLALLILLGVSMMSTDPLMELHPTSPEVLLTEEVLEPPVGQDEVQDRDQVLVTLATYDE
jgi:hypothetical protein